MGACEMRTIRDRLVREAEAFARRGDGAGAQDALDRAGRVWPVEEDQLAAVRALLDAAAGPGAHFLRDPGASGGA